MTAAGAPEAAAISDAELVKALVDYLLERKDGSAASRKKKAAVEAMKRLAIDAAMTARRRNRVNSKAFGCKEVHWFEKTGSYPGPDWPPQIFPC